MPKTSAATPHNAPAPNGPQEPAEAATPAEVRAEPLQALQAPQAPQNAASGPESELSAPAGAEPAAALPPPAAPLLLDAPETIPALPPVTAPAAPAKPADASAEETAAAETQAPAPEKNAAQELPVPAAEKAVEQTDEPADDKTAEAAAGKVVEAPREGAADAAPQAAPARSPASAAGLGRLLGALGLLSAAAALLLFAASHWLGWEPAVRVAFFGGLGFVLLLPVLFLKTLRPGLLDGLVTASGLATGLLLAVVGQTWQTGEGAAALMLGWGALLSPWLLLCRRPAFFTLWFGVVLGAALLQGDRMPGGFEALERCLPAALFAAAAALGFAGALRRQAASGVLRAAALAPALAASALLGLLPALMTGFGRADASMTALYGALALLVVLLQLFSRRPEQRAFAVLTIAAWANSLVLHAAPAFGVMSDNGIIYLLTLVNGLVFLCWSALTAGRRFSKLRRGPEAAAGRHDDAEGVGALLAELLPRAVAALLGAVAVVLAAATVSTLFGLAVDRAGWTMLLAAAALELFRRWRTRNRAAVFSPTQLLFFVVAAAGWCVVVDGDRAAAAAAALGLALVFRSRIALCAAALSAFSILPDAAVLPLALCALAVLAAALPVWIPNERLKKEILFWLPALLLCAWGALEAPALGFGAADPADPVFVPATLGLAALAAASGALALLKKGALTAPRAAVLFAGVAALLLTLPGSAGLVLALSAAAGATAAVGALRPGLAAVAILIALSACFAHYSAAPETGVNLLLLGAREFAFTAAALLAAAAAVSLRHDAAAAALSSGFRRLPRLVPTALILLTALALTSTIASRTELLETGGRAVLELTPVDPRDVVMGDFMALAYKADEETALMKRSGAPAAESAPAVLCLTRTEPAHAAAFAPSAAACPAGAAVRLDPAAGRPQLPRRWFFPSGDAERFSAARFADLRCRNGRCLIAGLLDGERRPISPTSTTP